MYLCMLHSRTIWIISNLFLASVQIMTYCKAGVLAIKKVGNSKLNGLRGTE
jgi:hypothetical protein